MDIEQRVSEHEVKLAKIELLLENVAINLDKISESIVKQEVLFEKMTNLESNTREGMMRVHSKVEDNLKELKKIECNFEKKQNELEPLLFLVRYPKIAIFSVVGLYLLSIEEIRKSIM